MDGYGHCQYVEALAIERLKPFLRRHTSINGQFTVIEKGPLARALQETIGDFIVNHRRDGRMRSIELKAEEKTSENLFLEMWSNHNFEDRDSRARHAPNPGWFMKSSADVLWYYFLDSGQLVVCDLMMLQRWAFGFANDKGTMIEKENIYSQIGSTIIYPHVIQRKNGQMNRTTGRLVPIVTLQMLGLAQPVIYPRRILQRYDNLGVSGE